MLKKAREDGYDSTIEKAIDKIKKRGFSEIRANFGELEAPANLVSQKNGYIYTPDATATNRLGRKAYFEISRKIQETEKLVNKWKVIETLATIKHGIFQIFVPHGSMKFTQDLVSKYSINAELVKL